MVKLQKTQVKIFCVALALVFIGSIVALGLSQLGTSTASAASSSVGVVDYRKVMMSHPDYASASSEMQKAMQEAQMRFEADNANKSDEEKAKAMQQAQMELQQKEQNLIEGIQKKVDEAVKQVAEAKGLSVVLDKNAVIYGGQEITDDVIKKLK